MAIVAPMTCGSWEGGEVAMTGMHHEVLAGSPAHDDVVSRSVGRGLVAFAVIWQTAWLLTNPALWPIGQASLASAILISVVLVTLPLIVVTTWGRWASKRWNRIVLWINIGALALAAMTLLAVDIQGTPNDWVAGASLINLTVVAAGLFLPLRVAIPVIGLVIASEFVILTGRSTLGVEAPSLVSDALYAANALALGCAAAGSRFALDRSTMRAENARRSIVEAESTAHNLHARTSHLLQQEVKVHETALNTLTAIGRGGLPNRGVMQERIRERAREASTVLAALAGEEVIASPLATRGIRRASEHALFECIADLRMSGVSVKTRGRLPSDLPDRVASVFVAAIRESVINVQRHADASHVRIRIERSQTRSGFPQVKALVSDNGVGFSPGETQPGFGIAQVIEGSISSIGADAAVSSTVGQGTQVRLVWPGAAHTLVPESHFGVEAVRGVALPALVSMWVLSGISLGATWGQASAPGIDVLAFAMYTALSILVIRQALNGFLRWPIVAVVALAAPVIYRVQESSLGVASSALWSEWASEALLALLFIIAATGPWFAGFVALGSWLITQGAITELTQPGTAVIVAGTILGLSLRRSVQDYMMQEQELVRAEQSVADMRVDELRLASRYSTLSNSGVVKLLDDVAHGVVDPAAPEIQAACLLHERHIRALMRLDPSLRTFDADIVRLSDVAHATGVFLDVVLPEGLPDLGPNVLDTEPGPAFLIAHMDPGSTARLSVHREGERVFVRCVGQVPRLSTMTLKTFPGGRMLMLDAATDTCMWEVAVDAPSNR